MAAINAKKSQNGYLDRREKFIIPYQKKMFAAIYDDYLLLYNTEKDSKPFSTINLKYCQVNHVEKNSSMFELHSDKQQKPHIFTAYNRKDANQWVHALNKIIEKPTMNQITPPPVKKIEEEEEEPEETYEVLTEAPKKEASTFPRIRPKVNQNIVARPVLPPRLIFQKPIPPTPEDTPDDAEEHYDTIHYVDPPVEEEEIYDTLQNEDEDIYDVINPPEEEEEEEEQIYDSICNDNNNQESLEEYHEIYEPEEEIKPPPPFKAKLFGRESAKLQISSPMPPKTLSTKRSFNKFMSKK